MNYLIIFLVLFLFIITVIIFFMMFKKSPTPSPTPSINCKCLNGCDKDGNCIQKKCIAPFVSNKTGDDCVCPEGSQGDKCQCIDSEKPQRPTDPCTGGGGYICGDSGWENKIL
jgi:hypothetical protein